MKYQFGVVALVALLGAQALAATQHVRDYGSFEYYQDKDSSKGEDNSFVATGPDNHFLAWKCQDGSITANLYDDAFKLKGEVSVIYQIDNQKAVGPQQWVASNTGKSAFVPDDDVRDLTRAAMKGRSIRLQLTDAAGKRSSYTYKLDGFSDAVMQLPCD